MAACHFINRSFDFVIVNGSKIVTMRSTPANLNIFFYGIIVLLLGYERQQFSLIFFVAFKDFFRFVVKWNTYRNRIPLFGFLGNIFYGFIDHI